MLPQVGEEKEERKENNLGDKSRERDEDWGEVTTLKRDEENRGVFLAWRISKKGWHFLSKEQK